MSDEHDDQSGDGSYEEHLSPAEHFSTDSDHETYGGESYHPVDDHAGHDGTTNDQDADDHSADDDHTDDGTFNVHGHSAFDDGDVSGEGDHGEPVAPGYDPIAEEPGWFSAPVDADLAPEDTQFADPFPHDPTDALPAPTDGLPWSDPDFHLESAPLVPEAAHLEITLTQDQLAAPTYAEQAVLDWLSVQ